MPSGSFSTRQVVTQRLPGVNHRIVHVQIQFLHGQFALQMNFVRLQVVKIDGHTSSTRVITSSTPPTTRSRSS